MTKSILIVLLVSVLPVVPGGRAYAHHSFSAAYLEDQIQRVEGDIAVVLFRNPHSWLHLDVMEKGTMARYSVEWGSGIQLTQQGVARDSIKVGDHVVVVGNPGRKAEEHRLRMRQIERPKDGWKWGGTFD